MKCSVCTRSPCPFLIENPSPEHKFLQTCPIPAGLEPIEYPSSFQATIVANHHMADGSNIFVDLCR